MSEQEIEISQIGHHQFDAKQQEWTGDESMQSSYFAGQQMLLIKSRNKDEVVQFELHYLGLKVGGFTSETDAQFNAASFTKSVLFTLDDLIKVDGE